MPKLSQKSFIGFNHNLKHSTPLHFIDSGIMEVNLKSRCKYETGNKNNYIRQWISLMD